MKACLSAWGKWLFLSLIAVMAVVLLTTAALLYSPVGPKLMVWGVQRILPKLSVGKIEGTVGTGITLQEVAYSDEQKQLKVEVRFLSVNPDLGCLLQPAICIDELQVDGVVFELHGSAGGNKDTPSNGERLSIPVPLKVNRLGLNDISVSVDDDNSLSWQSFAGGLSWTNSELLLLPTKWQGLTLNLPVSKDQSARLSPVAGPTDDQKPVFSGLSLPEIQLPLDLGVADLSFTDVRIIQGSTDYSVAHIAMEGTARNSDIDLQRFHVSTSEAEVSAHGRVSLQGVYPLSLVLDARYLKAPLKGQTVRVSVVGSLADLHLTGVADGVFKTNLKSHISLTQDNLPFEVKAHASSGRWPFIGEAQYYLNSDTLQAHGDLQNYSFDFKGLLKGDKFPDLSVSMLGEGTLNSVNLTRMELESSSSYVRGDLHADWRHDVTLTAQLALDNFWPGLFFPEAEGTLSGEVAGNANIYRDGRWAVEVGQLDISGKIENYPLIAKGQIRAHSEPTEMGFAASTQKLVIQHGPNQVSVAGNVTDSLDLTLDVDIVDLAKSFDQAEGRVKGHIQLTGKPDSPFADLDLSAAYFKWQDVFQAETVTLSGSIASIIHPKGKLQATVGSAIVQGQGIDSLQLDISGSVDDHSVILSAVVPEGTGQLRMRGGFSDAFSQWSGTLTDMQLVHDNETLVLLDHVSINADVASAKVDLGSHCWALADASLCLNQLTSISAQGVSASFSLKNLNLKTVEKWLPDENVSAEGGITGSAQIDWHTGQELSASGAFTVAKGQVTIQQKEPMAVGWDNISVQGRLKDGQLSSQLAVDLADNGQVVLQAEIADVKAKDKQLQGALTLDQINIDFLKPLLGENAQVHAVIDGDLQLSGHVLQPQVIGILTVKDMNASGEMLPVAINKGEMKLVFNGYAIDLFGYIQTPDGDLNLSGDADWQDLSQWTVNSHVTAQGLNVNVPPIVKMKVVPDLDLHFRPGSARIVGRVKIPSGLIEIEDLPESAVTVSKDQVIVDATGTPVQNRSMPFNVDTNIEVQIGDELRLSAFGLKGRLQGLLKIVQKDNAPFVTGDVAILDGTYRSLGQDLIIQQGNVMFNGPLSKPSVAITAIRNPENIENEVTAGLRVSGPADNPRIAVFSDPAMAQANALSYLLRGKDLGADGGDNSMTMTLIGLSLSQTGRIVSDIGQAVGIQDLELDTAGSGDDSQVTVSGYVLPGLKVKYGVGLFNSVGEFTLRYRLVKNLYLEAVSGLSSAVDLIYQFEF